MDFVKVVLIFFVSFMILWVSKPGFVYKYSTCQHKKVYDYQALVIASFIIAVVLGSLWIFLS